jgi:hypothetical protein
MSDTPSPAQHLNDLDLEARLAELAAHLRHTTVELIVHVAELEGRDLHLRQGYGSLFVYCRDVLALSEHDAYRIVAASRAVRRFPAILELLEQGAINLTTVKLLAPYLTVENHRRVLEIARGKKRAQVEEIVAMLVPQPDVPPAIARGLAGDVVPLSPERFGLQLTINADTAEKLWLAKDMLCHAIPSSDNAAVLERALCALLAELAKTKFANTDRPRESHEAGTGSRHIPAQVKREVWLRDLGRCAFVGSAGHRCNERGFLEFHHLQPYAAGGTPTAQNIQLRCRRHNAYEARIYFGQGSAVDRT